MCWLGAAGCCAGCQQRHAAPRCRDTRPSGSSAGPRSCAGAGLAHGGGPAPPSQPPLAPGLWLQTLSDHGPKPAPGSWRAEAVLAFPRHGLCAHLAAGRLEQDQAALEEIEVHPLLTALLRAELEPAQPHPARCSWLHILPAAPRPLQQQLLGAECSYGRERKVPGAPKRFRAAARHAWLNKVPWGAHERAAPTLLGK